MPKEYSGTIIVWDWDQTCTLTGGGSNEAATHFGLDYITATPETITQRYLHREVEDALKSALTQDHLVAIGTSQPMRQVILRALNCLLGADAKDVNVACAKPEKLVYALNKPDKTNTQIYTIPLHTKNLEHIIEKFNTKFKNKSSVEIENFIKKSVLKGLDLAWEESYAKDEWDAKDVAHMIALMDRVGLENISIQESRKEKYIWEMIKGLVGNPAECEKIVYTDDSSERLEKFVRAKPDEFTEADITTIRALPDTNNHFRRVMVTAGQPCAKLPVDKIKELSPEETKLLVDRLKITPIRLKKFTFGSHSHTFFVTPDAVKYLPRTMVKLGNDRYMVIGDVPKSAGLGANSKVKAEQTIKLNDNAIAFTHEKNGLVKIHFKSKLVGREVEWESEKQTFRERVNKEAALFKQYNHLNEQDVRLLEYDSEKGLRIYMQMPFLGTALSNAKLLSELENATRMRIIHRAIDKVETIHASGNVHFDLTLHNILYDVEKDDVNICDYGLTQASGQHYLTVINKNINPPRFAEASEDIFHYGYAYDVFSMGVSFAEFLGFEMREQNILPQPSFAVKRAIESVYEDDMSADDLEVPLQYESELADSKQRQPKEYRCADELFDFANNPRAVCSDVIGLLKRMMHPDPRERPSMRECKVCVEGLIPSAKEPINRVAFGC